MLITLPIGQYHTQCYCRFSEEFSRTRVKNALTNAWSLSTWAETNWAHNGCMLWGNRVGIPSQGQKQLLEGLLNAHPGMVRWKIWRGATYGGQGWIQKLKITSSHAKYVTRRDVDHLLKRHDVPGRTNHDDDGDLPDSAMPAEKNLVPSTAEVEQASEVTKETSPEAGIPPLDLRSDLRSSSTWRTL